MKIKIGQRWYAPRRGRPVMLVLSDDDKRDMAPMFEPENLQEKYAIFATDDPLFPDLEAKRKWMGE